MKIAAFQALVPKKSLLRQSINQFNSAEFYEHLDASYKRKAEAFWIMRIVTPHNSAMGIISLVDIIDAADDILPHEGTIPKKILKTINNIKQYGAQINPILLLYKEQAGLKQFMQEVVNIRPEDYSYNNDDTSYEFWRLNDRVSVRFFENHFAKAGKMFIADGHHRHAAQWEIFKQEPSIYNRYLLAALMPLTEMDIIGYNRLVKFPGSEQDLLQKLSHYVDIHPFKKDSTEISMHSRNGSYSLSIKPAFNQSGHTSEVEILGILHNTIFTEVFEIDINSESPQIKYVQAEGKLKNSIQNLKQGQYLFGTHAISLESFVEMVESGKMLPPKSTRFKPRMQKGLIVHKPRIRYAQTVG